MEKFQTPTLVVAFLLALGLLGLLGYSIVRTVLADSRITFCYVEASEYEGYRFFRLYGHRNWRPDSKVGVYLSIEETKNAADKMNCPLQ